MIVKTDGSFAALLIKTIHYSPPSWCFWLSTLVTSVRARRGDLLYTSLVTPGQCAQCLAQLMQCLEPCLGAFIFVIWNMEAQNACKETLPISLASRSGTSLDNIPCSLHHRHVCRTICATADWVMQTQSLHVCKTFFTQRQLLFFSPTSYPIYLGSKKKPITVHWQCCVTAAQWRFWAKKIWPSGTAVLLAPGQYIVWVSNVLPEN